MQMKTTIIIIFIALISFTYGSLVGAFKIPPYKLLEFIYNLNKPECDKLYLETNPASLINIKNEKDIINKRKEIIDYVWKGQGFPKTYPDIIKIGVSNGKLSDLDNLKRIDEITINMEYGVNSVIYHFHPIKSNNKLIIYHQGHSGSFDTYGRDAMQFFLNKGYSVLAFSMVLYGLNNNPIVETSFGKIKLLNHDWFTVLDNENFSSLRFFIEPVVIALNYVDKEFNYSSVDMIGISGGGWTTNICSAIDTRVSNSYSVQGSLPFYFQLGIEEYENSEMNFYRIANMLELYLMGAYGENRSQTQIFTYERRCLPEEGMLMYEQEIKSRIEELGYGNFDVFIDKTTNEHIISDITLDIVVNENAKTKK